MKWKVPILFSYAYIKKYYITSTLQSQSDKCRVFLDSGAFSAFKQGWQVDINEYCTFLKSPSFPIEHYFMLDVIGNPYQTKKNLDIMLKKGLKPIPVFTRGEDIRQLDQFYKISDLVAIGGVAGTPGNKEYVHWLSPYVNGRKVHWLGFFNRDLVLVHKPTSCDTAAVMAASKFGKINLFSRRRGNVRFDRNEYLSGKYTKELLAVLRECHVPELFYALKEEWHWHRNKCESALMQIAFLSWADYTYRLYKTTGTIIYAASTSWGEDLIAFIKAWEYILTTGGE